MWSAFSLRLLRMSPRHPSLFMYKKKRKLTKIHKRHSNIALKLCGISIFMFNNKSATGRWLPQTKTIYLFVLRASSINEPLLVGVVDDGGTHTRNFIFSQTSEKKNGANVRLLAASQRCRRHTHTYIYISLAIHNEVMCAGGGRGCKSTYLHIFLISGWNNFLCNTAPMQQSAAAIRMEVWSWMVFWYFYW